MEGMSGGGSGRGSCGRTGEDGDRLLLLPPLRVTAVLFVVVCVVGPEDAEWDRNGRIASLSR